MTFWPICGILRLILTTSVKYGIINHHAKKIREGKPMKHIQTLETRNLCESAKTGGCGECQTSCQSACKTSCGIANQKCEKTEK